MEEEEAMEEPRASSHEDSSFSMASSGPLGGSGSPLEPQPEPMSPREPSEDPDAVLGTNIFCADNLALLGALGLYKDPEEEERQRQREKLKKMRERKRRARPVGPVEPPRRSSRLDGIEVEFKELMDDADFGDEEYREQRRQRRLERRAEGGGGGWRTLYVPRGREVYTQVHFDALGDCVVPFPDVGFDKTYDPVNGTCCHQCRQKTEDKKVHCTSCDAVGSYFCGTCLQNRYGENMNEALEKADWLCPQCRGICNCSMCRNKAGYGASGPLAYRARQLGYKSVAHYLVYTNMFDPESRQKYSLDPQGVRRDLEIIEKHISPDLESDNDDDNDHDGNDEAQSKKHPRAEAADDSATTAAAAAAPAKKPRVAELTVVPPSSCETPSVRRSAKRASSKDSKSVAAATAAAVDRLGSTSSADGTPGIVWVNTDLGVVNWGVVRQDERFRTDEFLLPLGYKAVYRAPELRGEQVECQVLLDEASGMPRYVVSVGGASYEGLNCTAAVAAMLEARNLSRLTRGLDGAAWFGFTNSAIRTRIEKLSGADQVSGYELGRPMRPTDTRWELRVGDLVAVRTDASEFPQERFWIGRMVEDAVVRFKPPQKQSVRVSWFNRVAGLRYKETPHLEDSVAAASIFCVRFDHLLARRGATYTLAYLLDVFDH